MAAIVRLDFSRIVSVKDWLFGNALACGGPHIGDVNVLAAIVIEVGPTCAHAGAGIVDAGGIGDGFEGAVAVIAIKIAAAEIIGDVKVGPAVRIDVAPGAGKA